MSLKNKKPFYLPFALFAAFAVIAFLFSSCAPGPKEVRSSVIADAAEADTSGFARATGPVGMQFPRDYGPHPDFQTEWWYYTGNLEDETGRRFGFQLTFFRRAVQPPGERIERESAWALRQVYLAHFTLTDVTAGRFQAFERLERGSAGLAGAEIDPALRVWARDWSAEQTGPNTFTLKAKQGDIAIDLNLDDRKGPVLQGDRGYSRKGSDPGNASYYYSQTRLAASGSVISGGQEFQVSGNVWMDHEYSTSALQAGDVGWDWFALQLDDNSELMVYGLRREDGSLGAYSKGLLVRPDGSTRLLALEDFQIEVLEKWKSPHTGATYPAKWRVTVPSEQMALEVTPLLSDQELNLSYSYWEGAVRINGQKDGKAVTGYGYVELTGYAKPLKGV